MQIVNRDLSIAVLRSFVAKRQEELLSKEQRRKLKIQNCDSNSVNKKADLESCLESDAGINTEDTRAATHEPLRVLEVCMKSCNYMEIGLLLYV